MTAENILQRLSDTASALEGLHAPAAPGVYAYFLGDGVPLPTLHNRGGGPIYVGLSSNLAEREFDTHFSAGQTGFSTLRRSLGAILKEELRLRPLPRGTGASETNYRNYRFDDVGERRLSDWMHRCLRVAVHVVADPKTVEDELIALACPPLNLTGWANPEARAIKGLRKACADEARREHSRGVAFLGSGGRHPAGQQGQGDQD